MATVNAAAILVDLGDERSKKQARHLIDNRILLFLEHTPTGHVLNTYVSTNIDMSNRGSF